MDSDLSQWIRYFSERRYFCFGVLWFYYLFIYYLNFFGDIYMVSKWTITLHPLNSYTTGVFVLTPANYSIVTDKANGKLGLQMSQTENSGSPISNDLQHLTMAARTGEGKQKIKNKYRRVRNSQICPLYLRVNKCFIKHLYSQSNNY